MGKLIPLPDKDPPREPILVQAVVRLYGHRRWIPAGTATPCRDQSGRHLLCIRLVAVPANRRIYVPLRDVLVLAAQPPPDGDDTEAEERIGHA